MSDTPWVTSQPYDLMGGGCKSKPPVGGVTVIDVLEFGATGSVPKKKVHTKKSVAP